MSSLFVKIVGPTPVKVGLTTILLCWALYFSFGYHKPEFLSSLDARIVDTMFSIRGPEETTGRIVIVDIDEKSLHRFGQWPWPRDIVASLTTNIYKTGPVAVGFDILFAEPDRTSPARIISRYPELFGTAAPDEPDTVNIEVPEQLDHDVILGEAIGGGPGVLAYMFLFSDDGLKDENAAPFPSVNLSLDPENVSFAHLPLPRAYRAIVNIPVLTSHAASEGFFNIFPDTNGTVRKAPLFIMLDDLPYPSLPLEMARIGVAEPELRIQLSPLEDKGLLPVYGVSLGSRRYRTDDTGNLTINYRGPATTFITLSATDIIDGLDRELLAGKYVLIGSSAAGIMDIVATPFSPQMAGVEVHANILDNLLAEDFLFWENYTEIGLTYAAIAFFGLLLTFSLVYLTPLSGLLVAAAILSAVVGGNYFFLFLNHKLIGLSYLLFSLLAVTMFVTFANYFTEGRRKQFIRRAFSRYVPPSVVNELLKDQGKINLSVESRDVSILFSDIRKFTQLSETLPPAAVAHFLNRYLSGMTNIIVAHSGMVDKFIGDGIMAVWGTPLSDEKHELNSVNAALEMIAITRNSNDPILLGEKPVEIGIGINSGSVSAGNFGSKNRFTYTVLGDNVNLASRIEALTKYYGVPLLFSETVAAAVKGVHPCQFIDKVLVKGRHQPVALFSPDSILFNMEICPGEKEMFLVAMEAYLTADFPSALQAFTHLETNCRKRLYAVYRERCRNFCTEPPATSWQGVWDHN